VAIAENEETKYTIYITDDDSGQPQLIVYKSDIKITEEVARSEGSYTGKFLKTVLF